MKACITGAGGQIGISLMQTAPRHVETLGVDHSALDVTDLAGVTDYLERHRPEVIINAAAYTAVDRAESEPQLAARTNVDGVRHLAIVAGLIGARLIHVSTNYVFDGEGSEPYLPSSPANPLSVYGRTKREGEEVALALCGMRAVVVRTAWVYCAVGSNFVRTMLRLLSERDAVDVVADQLGTPTWAVALSEALWRFALRPDLHGIYHWTDGGVASWHEFATVIQSEAIARRLLSRMIAVTPVQSTDYPTAARRPGFGVLDLGATICALGHAPRHWRDNLQRMLDEMAAA